MGRLIACAIVLVGVAAPGASAADRYAVPSGGVSTGACSSAAPGIGCEIHYAVETAALSGDVVIVTAGTYDIGGDDVLVKAGITIRGASPALAPTIRSSSGSILRADSGAGAAGVTLRDLRLVSVGGTYPIDMTGANAGLMIERVRVTTDGSYPAEINCEGGSVLIRDSALIATGTHGAILTNDSGACTFDVRNVLFSAPAVALFVDTGDNDGANPAANLTMSLRNVILRGDHDGSTREGSASATITVGYSNFSGTSSAFTDTTGNQSAAPVFVDAAGGDFHQAPTSPTRNAGTIDAQTSSTDLDGNPRPQGLAPDIGPYELPPIPPAATTAAATGVTTSGAVLNGTVDPLGLPTTSRFEFGPSVPYAFTTAAQPAGSGHGAQPVSATIANQASGSTLHYRLVAENGEGTDAGEDAVVVIATPAATATATATAAPVPTATPKAVVRVAAALSLAVSPRRDRTAPYRFRVSGRLRLPAGVPSSPGCAGRVAVRFKRGRRTVSSRTLRVARDCSYSGRVSFTTRRARRASLRVQATFQGNQLLLPRRAADVAVRTR